MQMNMSAIQYCAHDEILFVQFLFLHTSLFPEQMYAHT